MSDIELRTLGPNCHVVHLGPVSLGFSYETIVGIATQHVWTMSENVWSKSTGKHINMIGGTTARRVPHDEFTAALKAVFDRLDIRREVFK
jgi:hypothetical protein